MNGLFVYRNRASRGARSLANGLGCKINRLRGSRFRPRDNAWIINWGCTDGPKTERILNRPEFVLQSVDKASLFAHLHATEGVRIPKQLSKAEAIERLGSGKRVVVRSLLRASGGRGMAVLESPSDPRLDTLDGRPVRYWGAYIPKLHEYRVHCAWGVGVFHIQHKRRLKGFNERNNQIRNHKNGWIYAVNEILYPEGDVLANAWRAFSATGLHFGAVDVIYNQGSNKSWVLEINTAPGLFGSTLEKYVEVLPRVMESIDKGNYF